ncbi:alpha/beta fold hydrolase [Streptomyces sp. NPDC020096]
MDAMGEDEFARSGVSSITSRGRQYTQTRSSRHVLLTEDGVRIEAVHQPARDGSDGLAVVLAHGFTGSLERPAVRRAAETFRRFGGVITFSFRGHGGSGGRSTVGDREVLDVDAAVRWARRLGYQRVATVGFSMGGSVVLRQAAARRAEDVLVDAVVSVSAPARWYYRGTAPMRRLHWIVTRPVGRTVSRYGLKTRIHPEDWHPVPMSPVEAVPLVAPTPLLIVHGDRDAYFPLDHPRALAAAAARDTTELWIEPGFGHAENSASTPLLLRIGGWLSHQPAAAGPPPGPHRPPTHPPARSAEDAGRGCAGVSPQ